MPIETARRDFFPLAAVLLLFVAGPALWAKEEAPLRKPSCPEDFGPAEIDVSSYPEEYQRTYREVFIPVFDFLRDRARTVNSPLVEMDRAAEENERGRHPALFADPGILQTTRDGWKQRVAEIQRRPPCCGACPVLGMEEAKRLWRFLVYDSLARKTGDNAGKWAAHRKSLTLLFEQTKQKEVSP